MTSYFGVCKTCKEYIDLFNFYSWQAYLDLRANYVDLDKEDLDYFKDNDWIYRTIRLHFFIAKHNGHQLGVYDEDDFFGSEMKTFKNIFPEPKRLKEVEGVVDFSDPRPGTLEVKTKYGSVYLHITKEGLSCTRFIDGEVEKTLLLPNKEKYVEEE